MTDIEWTDRTWNPVVGCSKVSEGCRNCYAINQAYRNAAMGREMPNPGRMAYYGGLTEKRGDRVEWTGVVNFVPEALEIPLKTRKPTRWFVNSMSDLFHESVAFETIAAIFGVMAATPRHTYQILTKRPNRMLDFFDWLNCHASPDPWTECHAYALQIDREQQLIHSRSEDSNGRVWPLQNVWLGVTAENQKAVDERIPLLRQTPAAIRFLSCEPLLEEIVIPDLSGISWIIIGGESGPGARPFNLEWGRSLIRQCSGAGVPAFMKQLGSNRFHTDRFGAISRYKAAGKGGNPEEWPEDMRVREWPKAIAASRDSA